MQVQTATDFSAVSLQIINDAVRRYFRNFNIGNWQLEMVTSSI